MQNNNTKPVFWTGIIIGCLSLLLFTNSMTSSEPLKAWFLWGFRISGLISLVLLTIDGFRLRHYDNGAYGCVWYYRHNMMRIKFSIRSNTVFYSLAVALFVIWEYFRRFDSESLLSWHPVWLVLMFPLLTMLAYLVNKWLIRKDRSTWIGYQ